LAALAAGAASPVWATSPEGALLQAMQKSRIENTLKLSIDFMKILFFKNAKILGLYKFKC
jgi:hypothetical protein